MSLIGVRRVYVLDFQRVLQYVSIMGHFDDKIRIPLGIERLVRYLGLFAVEIAKFDLRGQG